jgi:hypothetical protein
VPLPRSPLRKATAARLGGECPGALGGSPQLGDRLIERAGLPTPRVVRRADGRVLTDESLASTDKEEAEYRAGYSEG